MVSILKFHSLLYQLGIDETTTYFSNPFDSNFFVHWFLDAPHLLKLVRNHLLDHGFQKDGKMFVTCFPIKELLLVDGGFLRLAHKITRENLDVKGCLRQRVSQLL